MTELSDHLKGFLERRGINPDDVANMKPEPFDPVAWRIENHAKAFNLAAPSMFKDAQIDRQDISDWVNEANGGNPDRPWLLLSGDTGTGKTHVGYAALRELLLGAAHHNRQCRFEVTTHPELNAALRPKPDESHTWALQPMLTADVLFLDDLGAGKQSDFTGDNLIRLIDHRWANRLITIYTTNLDPDALEVAIGERAVSRLADALLVELDGPDRRFLRGAA
jgi:DNA replication protein DnaC